MDVFLATETLIIELLLVVSLVAIAVRRLQVPYTVALVIVGLGLTFRIVLFNFWEYLAFTANSLVFLLIGLDINLPDLLAQIGPIGVAVGAVLASRALVVYGLTWLSNRRRRGQVAMRYQHVQFWGGLRGAISLALALSLPAAFADRDLILVMTFGVVLFTLLVQGTTMHSLLKRLRLVQREEELGARAYAHLEAQQALLRAQPSLRAAEIDDARREALRAERTTLTELYSGGVLSEPIYSELVSEVDAALAEGGHAGAHAEARPMAPATAPPAPVVAPGEHEEGQ